MNLPTKVKVERQIICSGVWYEVMLSPFQTEEQAWDYVNKYHHYYPVEEQNYKITSYLNCSEHIQYFRGQFA
jgi:formylmethanofuran dehydrogenase subunit A